LFEVVGILQLVSIGPKRISAAFFNGEVRAGFVLAGGRIGLLSFEVFGAIAIANARLTPAD
jgi:hypothetical protein